MSSSSSQSNADYNYSLLDIIGTIFRWRKMIILLTVIVLIGTAIITLCIPNYYKAVATFMPINEEREMFSSGSSTQNNSLYGDKDAIDRLLIMAESPLVIGKMVTTFNLAERYDIDASTPQGQDKVNKRFFKMLKVKKNQYSGIEISIEDTDPKEAARMVDSMLFYIQDFYKQSTAQSKKELVEVYEKAIQENKEELSIMMDSLIMLRSKYKIYDVKTQGEELGKLAVETEALLAESRYKLNIYNASGGQTDSAIIMRANIEGLTQKLSLLRATAEDTNSGISLARFNQGRDKILDYETRIEAASENLAAMQKKYAQFKAQVVTDKNAIIILDPVQIPFIKSYPSRSIMVLGAGFLALVLGCLGAILLDMYKSVNWTEVLSDKKQQEK